MIKLLAACGIDCSDCDDRIATVANDDNKRVKVAIDWADEYGAGLTAEDINCTGCMEPGVLLSTAENAISELVCLPED